MKRDTHPSGAFFPRCDATSNAIRESAPRSTARCEPDLAPSPEVRQDESGLDGEPECTPARFDFPLDWKAVLRRVREEARRGCVPHEVQQALR
jgi:hypothetical protein